MNRIIRSCAALFLVIGLTSSNSIVNAQEGLEGAWKVVEATDSDQPGLYLFHGDYYSVLHIWNDGPRPSYQDDQNRDNVDHEKLLAIVGPVEGNSGKYSTDGSTLTMTPMVAISPNFMSGLSRTYTFTLSGDELTLQGGSVDGLGEFQRELKLRRLE